MCQDSRTLPTLANARHADTRAGVTCFPLSPSVSLYHHGPIIVSVTASVSDNQFFFTDSGHHDAWLDQVQEEIIEPDLPFVDAHHHLWMREPPPYLALEYFKDVSSGHNVVASVFAQCHSMYRKTGPEHLRCIGESEFVSGIGAMSDSGAFSDIQICKVMFGDADLMLGDDVTEVIEAHEVASGGRFRGVRVAAPYHPGMFSAVDDAEYLARDRVRTAIGRLAERGHSLDCWVYHTQLDQVAELADAFPDLTIILNHFGVPILGGPFRGKAGEVFEDWKQKITNVATRQNVVFKLGALPIRRESREKPPTSDEIVASWKTWIDHAIASFSPARCMFESNFPVDKRHCSYPVLVNAFKKLSAGYSASEKEDLFSRTATRAYRMNLNT